jgi:hypothetical protein
MVPVARSETHFFTNEQGILVRGFKKFLTRGNLIELAVAVIIGAVT